MFAEMQAFASNYPSVSPERILQMATINGARALGMAGQVGEISEKALADLIALPFKGKLADAGEAALNYPDDVAACLIDGEWAIAPA
jgi:imidazolonepropionase-like amidohydrolase